MKFPTQLFYISGEAILAMTVTETDATAAALKQLGLYKLPYPSVSVRAPADYLIGTPYDDDLLKDPDIARMYKERYLQIHGAGPSGNKYMFTNFGPCAWLEFTNLNLEHPELCRKRLVVINHPTLGTNSMTYSDEEMARPRTIEEIRMIADLLIVLLATRNAVKHTVEHKAAKLGIGRGDKRYSYVTTIHLPRVLDEDHESVKGNCGAKRAPHLRRGHIRNQRIGPGREFTKQIFIEPMFINADPDWVSKRERYNVSL